MGLVIVVEKLSMNSITFFAFILWRLVNPWYTFVMVDHAEDNELCGFHGQHKDFLPGELPSVKHISLYAHIAFVSEEQIDVSLIAQIFRFL